VALFKRSETFADLMGFILACNQAGFGPRPAVPCATHARLTHAVPPAPSVKGVSSLPPPPCSAFASAFVEILSGKSPPPPPPPPIIRRRAHAPARAHARAELQNSVSAFPPVHQPMRYGNVAFRCKPPPHKTRRLPNAAPVRVPAGPGSTA
jgi:hypothetical protein